MELPALKLYTLVRKVPKQDRKICKLELMSYFVRLRTVSKTMTLEDLCNVYYMTSTGGSNTLNEKYFTLDKGES